MLPAQAITASTAIAPVHDGSLFGVSTIPPSAGGFAVLAAPRRREHVALKIMDRDGAAPGRSGDPARSDGWTDARRLSRAPGVPARASGAGSHSGKKKRHTLKTEVSTGHRGRAHRRPLEAVSPVRGFHEHRGAPPRRRALSGIPDRAPTWTDGYQGCCRNTTRRRNVPYKQAKGSAAQRRREGLQRAAAFKWANASLGQGGERDHPGLTSRSFRVHRRTLPRNKLRLPLQPTLSRSRPSSPGSSIAAAWGFEPDSQSPAPVPSRTAFKIRDFRSRSIVLPYPGTGSSPPRMTAS